MAQNIQLNPRTRDYVFTLGSPIPSNRILEASYIAITIPKNKWLYGNSNQGSLLYTLQNSKRTASIEQKFASFASDAINAQVVQAGQASSVSVENIEATQTGTVNQINVTESNVGVSQQFNFVGV